MWKQNHTSLHFIKNQPSIEDHLEVDWGLAAALVLVQKRGGTVLVVVGGAGRSPIAVWPLLLERSNDKTLKVKEGTQRPGRESPLQRQAAYSEVGIQMKTFTSVPTEIFGAESSTSAKVKDGQERNTPKTSCTLWDLISILYFPFLHCKIMLVAVVVWMCFLKSSLYALRCCLDE